MSVNQQVGVQTDKQPAPVRERNSLAQRVTNRSVALVERYLPDSFTMAVLLTVIALALGIWASHGKVLGTISTWGNKGILALLTFTMQAALVALLGYVLATVPVVVKGMDRVARLARTPAQATVLAFLVGAVLSWINWGLGLAGGATFALAIARAHKRVHYPLVVAASYIGFLTWGTGLSGTIPLFAAESQKAGNPLAKIAGTIPVGQTIWSARNLIALGAIVVVMAILIKFMIPPEGKRVTVPPEVLLDRSALGAAGNGGIGSRPSSPAARLDAAPWLGPLVGIIGLVAIGYYFGPGHGSLTYNAVIIVFFFLGLIGHRSLPRFMASVGEGVQRIAPILIQFPFYAGIMVILETSGLGPDLSHFFASISSAHTFPFWTFVSSGITNLFVPSGGGHWAVQGPYIIPAAKAVHASLGKTVLGISYGEQWMNMAQPFWALPLLGIAGLGVRDIFGYCILTLLAAGAIFGIAVLV